MWRAGEFGAHPGDGGPENIEFFVIAGPEFVGGAPRWDFAAGDQALGLLAHVASRSYAAQAGLRALAALTRLREAILMQLQLCERRLVIRRLIEPLDLQRLGVDEPFSPQHAGRLGGKSSSGSTSLCRIGVLMIRLLRVMPPPIRC